MPVRRARAASMLLGTGAATFIISGTPSTTFFGTIQDGAGTTALEKNGTGTFTLGTINPNFTNAGKNTFTGGVTLNQGGLQVNDPQALGKGDLSLVGGTLLLKSNGGGINGTIVVGNPATNISTTSSVGIISSAGDPRQIQFGLKFLF